MQKAASRLSEIFLLVLLVVSPILWGSNRPIFELVNLTLAVLAVGFFVVSGHMQRLILGLVGWQRRLLIFLFLILPLWVVAQALAFTPEFMHHPIWVELGVDGGAISLNAGLTWHSLVSYMSLSVVLIGIYMANYDIAAAHRVQIACFMTICLVAVFGLVSWWYSQEQWLAGTFIYKNAMASFVGFGMMISAAHLMVAEGKKRWAVGFCFLALVLVLTGSRGGLVSVLAGLVFMLMLRAGDKRLVMWIGVVGLAVIGVYYLALNREAAEAIGNVQVRIGLFKDAWAAMMDRPILGHGAGTFIEVEPLYHDANKVDDLLWNKLHSTHFELVLGLGIPAALAVYYAVFRVFGHLLRDVRLGVAGLVAVGVLVQMLVHGAVDFTLQIPAISLYAFLLVSLAFKSK